MNTQVNRDQLQRLTWGIYIVKTIPRIKETVAQIWSAEQINRAFQGHCKIKSSQSDHTT